MNKSGFGNNTVLRQSYVFNTNGIFEGSKGRMELIGLSLTPHKYRTPSPMEMIFASRLDYSQIPHPEPPQLQEN